MYMYWTNLLHKR